MNLLWHSLRAINRSKGKSIIVVAVTTILVLFFTMYANGITNHREALAYLHESITVTGQITNYNGTVTDNLDIPADIIEVLESSDFISESFYTRNLLLLTEPWVEMETTDLSNLLMNAGKLVGANAIEGIPELASHEENPPQYLEGYDAGLFASSEELCILSQDLMHTLNLELGDTYEFTVVENVRAKAGHPHGTLTLKIVGVSASSVRRSAYCPWNVMTAAYQDLDIPPTWDSAWFNLTNTLRMQEFEALLSKYNFLCPYEVGDAIVGQGRLGFIVNDRLLSNVTSSVKGYIDFMTALYPVIYLLSAAIGFVSSFLQIRLRKPEFAIMRSLGTSKGRCFLNFLWEQVILSLLGATLGILLTLAVTQTVTTLQVLSTLGYLACYLTGAALAIISMNRMNTIEILTAKE